MVPFFRNSQSFPETRVEFEIWDGITPFKKSLQFMEKRALEIANGDASECVILVEHPSLYTAGTSAKEQDLLNPQFPIHKTGRGGQFTYHGHGQRVIYVMIDLKARKQDVRAFITALEAWIIKTLSTFNISGFTHPDRVGIWVKRPQKSEEHEDKIAAIGIRLQKWVSFHGISLNISPNLEHFKGIVPCGINEPIYGVTSMQDLGVKASFEQVDNALINNFENIFGGAILKTIY